MKFGPIEVPARLFELARERLAQGPATPVQVRQHLLDNGKQELEGVTPIDTNQWIVANRVFDAVRLEMVAAGTLTSPRRGHWEPVER